MVRWWILSSNLEEMFSITTSWEVFGYIFQKPKNFWLFSPGRILKTCYKRLIWDSFTPSVPFLQPREALTLLGLVARVLPTFCSEFYDVTGFYLYNWETASCISHVLIRKGEKSNYQDDVQLLVVRVLMSSGQVLIVVGCSEQFWKFYVLPLPVA